MPTEQGVLTRQEVRAEHGRRESRPARFAGLARVIEDGLAWPMFYLSCLFLVVFSILIHEYRWPLLRDRSAQDLLEALGWTSTIPEMLPRAGVLLQADLATWLLLLLWVPIALEACCGFLIRDRTLGFWRPLGQACLIVLLPPFRLAARSRTRRYCIWLPRLGWRRINDALRGELDRIFSFPMILFALLVIPVLAIDYFWSSTVQASPALQATLAVCNSVIWLAFALELIIKVSAANRVLFHLIREWVDVAIVVLPILDALLVLLPYVLGEAIPAARLLRLGRLIRLKQMARLYRLRGLASKGWRALLVLKVFEGLLRQSRPKQLEKRQQELENLKDEVTLLDREINLLVQKESLDNRPGDELLHSGG